MAQVEVKSEISGTVWKLETEPGQKVAAGDTVLVVESMKMEIPVLAETAGTIRLVCGQGRRRRHRRADGGHHGDLRPA